MLVDKLDRQECHKKSMPKLESHGAKFASQLKNDIARNSNETYNEIIIYSDIITVPGGIHSWRQKYKIFKKLCLKRICYLSNEFKWKHVPTLTDPANITRAKDKKKWDFFHYGPNFIYFLHRNGLKNTLLTARIWNNKRKQRPSR